MVNFEGKDVEEKFRIDFQAFESIKAGKFVHNKTGGDGVLGLGPHSDEESLELYDFMDQLVKTK